MAIFNFKMSFVWQSAILSLLQLEYRLFVSCGSLNFYQMLISMFCSRAGGSIMQTPDNYKGSGLP